MRVGTKSLLFGSHQFLIHPLMVAIGWRVKYKKWPRDWRIWFCFLVHDWGYWGKPNIDGKEGKLHPLLGAQIAARMCGGKNIKKRRYWFWFSFCHSRSAAEYIHASPSALMIPDKLATALLPMWLLYLLYLSSGEWREYIEYWKAVGDYSGEDTCWSFTKAIHEHWQRFRSETDVWSA